MVICLYRHEKEYFSSEKKNNFKGMFWIFFGIVFFIAIYIPFLAPNLRYQIGSVFSAIFDFIGGLCLFVGFLLFIWGIAGVLCGRNFRAVSLLILGVLMIWIGMFLLEPTSGFGTNATSSKGYH